MHHTDSTCVIETRLHEDFFHIFKNKHLKIVVFVVQTDFTRKINLGNQPEHEMLCIQFDLIQACLDYKIRTDDHQFD